MSKLPEVRKIYDQDDLYLVYLTPDGNIDSIVRLQRDANTVGTSFAFEDLPRHVQTRVEEILFGN